MLSAVAAGLLLVGGCGYDPELADLSADEESACEAFVADLPATLAGEQRESEGDRGAEYGDPAITVTCGVVVPDDFNALSTCQVANDVAWYVPPAQIDDQDADASLSTAGYRPVVEVRMPHEYRPSGPASAIAELADLVAEHLTLVENCD